MGTIFEGLQIDALVLHATPEPFDEDVVPVAAFSIHADPDAMGLQYLGERLAGELAALIAIEDARRPIALQGLLQCVNAEVRIQGVRYPPGQHTATVPVHDGHQVHEPSRHWDIRHISGPDLVGTIDDAIPEQVRIDPMPHARLAGARLRVHRVQPHLPHQATDPLAVHRVPQAVEMGRHPPGAVDRRPQMLLVDQPH